MRTSYLVDGYNLLFQIGLFDGRAGAHALEEARNRLLDLLKTTFANADDDVTVVFDSARTRRCRASPVEHGGLRVQFTSRGEEADDVIEEMIARCPNRRGLVVISNDHRVQHAATRNGAQAWSCDAFLDWKDMRPVKPQHEAPEPDRSARPSRREVQHWLSEFGDLANDPDFREVFDRFPFEDQPDDDGQDAMASP
jgi:predicted RNA-binding protein with PIN domain